VYGMPIASYMKQYRMNQAITLLRETDYSMAQIAIAVGYENQSKFTAAFKNVIGVLPTTYKKTIL
ncbi:MAG: AraC family transcriptional regulator, partial [bacterium]|nr:AraC family transcriptional regulator [bacterium]